MKIENIKTLGELIQSGYQSKRIKDELRDNLRAKIIAGQPVFEGVHGFENTDDYWRRASAKPGLSLVRVPALVLNALNDPFVPANSLPHAREVGSCVTLWQPAQGGHVGFPAGKFPAHLHTLPENIGAWLQASQGSSHG